MDCQYKRINYFRKRSLWVGKAKTSCCRPIPTTPWSTPAPAPAPPMVRDSARTASLDTANSAMATPTGALFTIQVRDIRTCCLMTRLSERNDRGSSWHGVKLLRPLMVNNYLTWDTAISSAQLPNSEFYNNFTDNPSKGWLLTIHLESIILHLMVRTL